MFGVASMQSDAIDKLRLNSPSPIAAVKDRIVSEVSYLRMMIVDHERYTQRRTDRRIDQLGIGSAVSV